MSVAVSSAEAAACAVVEQIVARAPHGDSVPSRLLEPGSEFVEWAHYPQPDAVAPDSGWRFYYHAHAARQRLATEHGNFHIFAPPPLDSETMVVNRYSHRIGISVEARGLRLRLVTTNRWLTDEIWQDAA